jgi:hypothetical protein
MIDITPWDGIVPIFNDLVVFGGVALYYFGKHRGRKKTSTSLVKV